MTSGMTRRLPLAWILLLLGSLLLVSAAPTAASTRGRFPRELTDLRQATAKYNRVGNAIADGYIEKPINGVLCVEDSHHGAMGVHYLNPGLIDGVIDPLKPEVLLYEQHGNSLWLTGVEYFEPDIGQPHPSVWGVPFDGPMPGLEPGMPVHYSLHVWVWKTNPAGVFAKYNPTVSC